MTNQHGLDSFILLQETLSSGNESSHHKEQLYTDSITPIDSIRVYIKAVEKMESLLLDIGKNIISNKNASFEAYDKMRLICEEFRKNFSVTSAPEGVQLMSLLFRAFDYVQERLDLYILTKKITDADEAAKYLVKIKGLFGDMENLLINQSQSNLPSQIQENTVLTATEEIAA
ncbi:MAG: hypothetical protein ACK5WS_00680 [Alphaproteobacteria bacterium]|jgi:hypothetical protein|nr:hypothetical protein [Candidatus Jidaibacter sp.]